MRVGGRVLGRDRRGTPGRTGSGTACTGCRSSVRAARRTAPTWAGTGPRPRCPRTGRRPACPRRRRGACPRCCWSPPPPRRPAGRPGRARRTRPPSAPPPARAAATAATRSCSASGPVTTTGSPSLRQQCRRRPEPVGRPPPRGARGAGEHDRVRRRGVEPRALHRRGGPLLRRPGDGRVQRRRHLRPWAPRGRRAGAARGRPGAARRPRPATQCVSAVPPNSFDIPARSGTPARCRA